MIPKYNALNHQLREKESELYQVSSETESLRREIKALKKSESNHEYEIRYLNNELEKQRAETNSLKEKVFKSGTIMKQTLLECDDLRKTLNMYKTNETSLKEENCLLTAKLRKYEGDNLHLLEQLKRMNRQQQEVVSELDSMEYCLANNSNDMSSLKLKLGYLVNRMRKTPEVRTVTNRRHTDYHERSAGFGSNKGRF